jgi:uncharacterized protein (DUF885 family)
MSDAAIEGAVVSGEHPGDARVAELAKQRFDRLVDRHPLLATALGIHTEDSRLDDQSRAGVEQDIADDEVTLAAFEAVDASSLSADGLIERDLAIHGLRRELFDAKVHRVWERRSDVFDTIGGSIFLLLVRDYAPMAERLRSITSRLEAVPAALEQHKSRLGRDLVRLWNDLELEAGEYLPVLFGDAIDAAQGTLDDQERDRLEVAAEAAKAAIAEYSGWLKEQIVDAGDDFVLGRERYDELIRLREFDGLDTDQILEIG